MKTYIRGFFIICVFWGIGELLNTVIPYSIPGSVLGIVLLWFALHMGLVRLHWIERVADFMLKHMALLFIPAIVNVINFYDVFAQSPFVIAISLVVPLLAVQIVTASIAHFLGFRSDQRGRRTS